DRVMVPAPTGPADAPGRHGAPRPERPLSGRDRVRDLGLVVIERRVAAAPDGRATIHPVHRARRDREPSRPQQAPLLTAAISRSPRSRGSSVIPSSTAQRVPGCTSAEPCYTLRRGNPRRQTIDAPKDPLAEDERVARRTAGDLRPLFGLALVV